MINTKELPAEYSEANDDWQKATAALAIASRKQNRIAAWEWANTAARHAENVDITNARNLLGTGNYPDLTALAAAIATRRKNELLIVTRHYGLVEWLKRRGYSGRVVSRATPADVLNKHVIGKLPMHLCAITASITSVHVPGIPDDKIGSELTADEMDKHHAFLRTYIVKEITVLDPY